MRLLFCCVVSPSRSDHLYVFFMQWSPDMYGEGVRGMEQEPGFMVVKKNEVCESAEDEPITDLNVKEWEVRSPVPSSCCGSSVSSSLWFNPLLSQQYVAFSVFLFVKILIVLVYAAHTAVVYTVVLVKPTFCILHLICALPRTAAYAVSLLFWYISITYYMISTVYYLNTCFAWKCTSLDFQPKCFACLCSCLPFSVGILWFHPVLWCCQLCWSAFSNLFLLNEDTPTRLWMARADQLNLFLFSYDHPHWCCTEVGWIVFVLCGVIVGECGSRLESLAKRLTFSDLHIECRHSLGGFASLWIRKRTCSFYKEIERPNGAAFKFIFKWLTQETK